MENLNELLENDISDSDENDDATSDSDENDDALSDGGYSTDNSTSSYTLKLQKEIDIEVDVNKSGCVMSTGAIDKRCGNRVCTSCFYNSDTMHFVPFAEHKTILINDFENYELDFCKSCKVRISILFIRGTCPHCFCKNI